MNEEIKYKAMTEQLRIAHTDEEVAGYLRWIITSEEAKQYWQKQESRTEILSIVFKQLHYEMVLAHDTREPGKAYFMLRSSKDPKLKIKGPTTAEVFVNAHWQDSQIIEFLTRCEVFTNHSRLDKQSIDFVLYQCNLLRAEALPGSH